MKNENFKSNKLINWYTFSWLLLVSFFTVFKYSPADLNGDVILNSVMSLQNVTLYYWGQNRLINVLPFIASFISDPNINLLFILFFSSISFFVFLYLLSVLIIKITNAKNINYFDIFLFITSVFILFFSDIVIFEITMGHIEYSLPALLISYVFFITYYKNLTIPLWSAIATIFIFISIGLNPSNLLSVLFILFFIAIYKKNINLKWFLIFVVTVFSFFIWSKVASKYSNYNYGKFDFLNIIDGIPIVTISFYNNLKIINLFIGFIIIVIFTILNLKNLKNYFIDNNKNYYLIFSILFFILCWFFIFTSSDWVKSNQYHWRYFVNIIFGFIFLISLLFVNWFSIISNRLKKVFRVMLVIIVLAIIVIKPVSFNQFRIFEKINIMTPKSYNFYTGDHFLVWPAVQRDLMAGKVSFGLGYRGIGNKKNVSDFISEKLKKQGFYTVLCFKDSTEGCLNQIHYVIGNVFLIEEKKISNDLIELKLTDKVNKLIYKDDKLLNLNGNTGIKLNNGLKTNGVKGCLFFGPYFPLYDGKYILNVMGSSNNSSKAFVDVVDGDGKIVYAKFKINSYSNDYLISNGEVEIPKDNKTIEVRLCVDEQDDILVKGYELLPVSPVKYSN